MDYEDIINQTWEDVPEEQLLPGGGWLVVGRNVAFMKPREEGKAARVVFFYKAKQPVQVAPDLLEELGDYDYSVSNLQYQIFIENASDWDKVRRHAALHGVELKGKLFAEGNKLAFSKDFTGTEVIAEVGQRSYENNEGETVWNNTLAKFQRVEA